jgi:hypothetical protein
MLERYKDLSFSAERKIKPNLCSLGAGFVGFLTDKAKKRCGVSCFKPKVYLVKMQTSRQFEQNRKLQTHIMTAK